VAVAQLHLLTYFYPVKHKQTFLIGIAGGSGSGKTSFLRELMNHFTADDVALVSQDNYYEPKEKQHVDENGQHNFDMPTSINRTHFHDDMMRLVNGDSIEKLEYNFNNPAWEPQKVIVNPAPVIIMEGLFVFHYEEIWNQLDYKVYIDVHHEERLQRRIQRVGNVGESLTNSTAPTQHECGNTHGGEWRARLGNHRWPRERKCGVIGLAHTVQYRTVGTAKS
jgi:uridine kinase